MPNNLTNNYRTEPDFKLYYGDYWDLFLSEQRTLPSIQNTIISGDSLITRFDFDNDGIYSTGTTSANTIHSLDEWSGAVNNGVNSSTIGLTGIDNGFITFNKTSGDTNNTALLSALTGSTLTIPSGDTSFFMNRVTGTTGNYIYPIEIESESEVGDFARLCGGFYQGFFKLEGYNYQTLPSRYKDGWTAEFWLRKDDDVCSGYTATTLNDEYPDNKGFFFYMGTRAENKFWNIFDGLNSDDCNSSAATTYCTEVKETDIDLTEHVSLSPPKTKIRTISNQFLLYHRANEGAFDSSCFPTEGNIPGGLASEFTGGSVTISETQKKVVNDTNPFLLYHRANEGAFDSSCFPTEGGIPGGLASEFSGVTAPIKELDKEADIVDNAIGFRIKDDGSLSYRKLTAECIGTGEPSYTAVTVEEHTTSETPINEGEWSHIAIRFEPYKTFDEDCDVKETGLRKGKLSIYVNGKLKMVVRDFDEVYARNLDEHRLKQVGVPYNISIGGGSQGLIESQTFDGPDPKDKGLFIEKNFAGTFIGDISKFRLYNTPLNWCEIQNNIDKEKKKYGLNIPINCR